LFLTYINIQAKKHQKPPWRQTWTSKIKENWHQPLEEEEERYAVVPVSLDIKL
jgi:hypothetical protein